MEEEADAVFVDDDPIETGRVFGLLKQRNYDEDFTIKVICDYLEEYKGTGIVDDQSLTNTVFELKHRPALSLRELRILKSFDPHLQGGKPDAKKLIPLIVEFVTTNAYREDLGDDPHKELKKVVDVLKNKVQETETDQLFLLTGLDHIAENNISIPEWSVLRKISAASTMPQEVYGIYRGGQNYWLSDLYILLTLRRARRENVTIY